MQENQAREIAVAAKNRERVLAIETERIEKDRLLEVIARERETELSRISKDKELEGEKRSIAEVIRERIVVGEDGRRAGGRASSACAWSRRPSGPAPGP
ncbi:hypothetical protein GCM10018952_21020 [Streptosporangium vulgare]